MPPGKLDSDSINEFLKSRPIQTEASKARPIVKMPPREEINPDTFIPGIPGSFSNSKKDNRNQSMALMFAAAARTEDIAKMFDLTPNTVSTIRRSPMMVAIVRRIQENVQRAVTADMVQPLKPKLEAAVNAHTESAVETIAHLMTHGESESVQLQASESILDRSPEAPKKVKHVQQDTRSIQITIGADEVRSMAEAAQALGEDFDGIDIDAMVKPAEKANADMTELEKPHDETLGDFIKKALDYEQEESNPFNRDDYF